MSYMLRAMLNKLPFMGVKGDDTLTQDWKIGDKSTLKERVPPPILDKVGLITVLDEETGRLVIDREYVWTREDSTPQFGYRKGDKVKFSAHYSKDDGAYVVTSVSSLGANGEDAGGERGKYRKLHYKVANLRKDCVVANNGVRGNDAVEIKKSLLPNDYPVRVGDWLEVTVEMKDDPEDYEGTIVSTDWSEKSVVSGRAILHKDSWTVSYRVMIPRDMEALNGIRHGDYVKVVAIASDQTGVSSKRELVSFRKRAVSLEVPKMLARNAFRDQSSVSTEDLEGDGCQLQMEELCSDKDGIVIRPPVSNMLLQRAGGFGKVVFEVENSGKEEVTLMRCSVEGIQDTCKVGVVAFDGGPVPEGIKLLPKTTVRVQVNCTAVESGRTTELIMFYFENCCIGRMVIITTLKDEDGKISKMESKVSKDQRGKIHRQKNKPSPFVDTARRVTAKPIRQSFYMPNKIEFYNVPKSVKRIFKNADEDMLKQDVPQLDEPLDASNYVDRFSHALWFEELENQKLRDQFNIYGVELARTSDASVFSLAIPRILDVTPPLMPGDPVLMAEAGNTRVEFQGYVYKLMLKAAVPEVEFKFNEKFQYGGGPVNLKFMFSRTNFRRQHFAVTQARNYLATGWLFPTEVETKSPRMVVVEDEANRFHVPIDESPIEKHDQKPELVGRGVDIRAKNIFQVDSTIVAPDPMTEFKLKWYNKNLNDEQKDAVRRILKGQGRPLPYVVFGPPGTGKTVTLVEAILQIYFMDKNSRILVTVPSNAGADIIAEHLINTNRFCPGDLVRFNGFTRCEMGVSESLAYYCMDGEKLESVAKHRLIICTVVTAGQFFSLNLYTGHFSHVFLDEAGYCTEPEAMIACVLSAIDKEGQVILAGDPKQLGPVLMCDFGVCSVLHKSYLERLMDTPLYGRNEDKFPETKYNPLILTKLVKNYRSHPCILQLPSQMFYDGELEAFASRDDAYELSEKLDFLPKRGFPLIFHGVHGKNEQDVESPSWFNLAEVSTVVKYVDQLLAAGVKGEDIGVITPYRKQVEKIRVAFGMYFGKQNGIKVASVQEFQGGERKVMIISTVRVNMYNEARKGLFFDFIYSKKLFNVSVTRAKGLMIVIGDPHALFPSTCWGGLLKYCVDAGVYKGCDLPPQLSNRIMMVLQRAAAGQLSTGAA